MGKFWDINRWMEDAPEWYTADEAMAWVDGYNTAIGAYHKERLAGNANKERSLVRTDGCYVVGFDQAGFIVIGVFNNELEARRYSEGAYSETYWCPWGDIKNKTKDMPQ